MKKKDTNYSNFALKLVLICTILILGSTIIFSFSSHFKTNKENEEETQTKEETEEEKLIKKLYKYVTYGRDLQPMYYFFRNDEVTSESFEKSEKVAYAFQLANKSNVTDLTERSFTVSGETYKNWIETIFGKETEFDNSKAVTVYTNDLLKNSIVTIEYDATEDQYTVTKVDGFVLNDEEDIKDFYSAFYDYSIDNENKTISIREKVIFTPHTLSDDGKTIQAIKVYKDIYQTELISEVENPSKEQLKSFGINNYLKDASVITYTFKMDDEGNYYFYSSKIEK